MKASVRFLLIPFFVLALGACTLIPAKRVVTYVHYPVRAGDTPESVARQLHVSADLVTRINGGSTLLAGTTLKIPAKTDFVHETKKSAPVKPHESSVRQVSISSAKRFVGALEWPVKNGSISSKFGRRWLSFHEGLDIVAPIGAPVRAAHDGTVVYSGNGLRGYGNLVVIRAEGLLTVYAHNRSNVVRVGRHVSRGSVIAYLGDSGKSSGPHLHFETRIKDKDGKNVAVDPLAFYGRSS